jgi:hypothetical protein
MVRASRRMAVRDNARDESSSAALPLADLWLDLTIGRLLNSSSHRRRVWIVVDEHQGEDSQQHEGARPYLRRCSFLPETGLGPRWKRDALVHWLEGEARASEAFPLSEPGGRRLAG